MLESPAGAPGLLDRVHERGTLEQVVADVRSGRSHVLVMRGEAGVGKTALLRYLTSATDGCLVAWATGVEAEMELAFHKRLRDEMKFPNTEALVEQIQRDVETVRQAFST